MFIIEREHIDSLFAALAELKYQLIGPTVHDGAIHLEEITSVTQIPVGWADQQDGGAYRLKKRNDKALFGYVVGPHSWKKFLHPPTIRLWHGKRDGRGIRVEEEKADAPARAFIGVRPCELHAIAIQDKIFMNGSFTDRIYQSRRKNIFIVAVNCGQAGGTCFCASMNTGPRASAGFDLALTEVIENNHHYFVTEVGSDRGEKVLMAVPHQAAGDEHGKKVENIAARTVSQMGRTLDTNDLKNLLYHNYEHPRWNDVASRCLNCTNCTMVCPTCFCTTVEDVTDLTGQHIERVRKWDSCFTVDFSYIHGGSVRSSAKARYRQWMVHKLAAWIDQFGSSGCVGCGRCITWCPVGIDITKEAKAIREPEKSPTTLIR
jgi:ferredoxin